MNKWLIILICILICTSLAVLFLSCNSGGDDDDDDRGKLDDDDDMTGDDDTAGDDDATTDDDTSDDDVPGDTWTDSFSGLTWQNDGDYKFLKWEDAKSYCDNLILAGGGWHLPTISELRSLIRSCDTTELGGACGVTDSCIDLLCWDENLCGGCDLGGGSDGCFWPAQLKGYCGEYWSSSEVADDDATAWVVWFDSAIVIFQFDVKNKVRCVR